MKSIIKKILLNISFALSGLYNPNNIKFIYYHDVVLKNGFSFDSINVDKFRYQMNYILENGYETLSFDDLDGINKLNTMVNGKKILITFDDGYRSTYDIVFPIMERLNLKFNIFLEVGAINKKNYLTWNMINEMKSSGLVGIGAHTYSHIDSRYINKLNMDKEIFKVNKEIFMKTGLIVKDYCFPFGTYDKNIIKFLDEINVYKRLYTSDGRPALKKNNVILYGRVGIENEDTNKTFISKLEGKYNLYYFMSRYLKNMMKGARDEVIRRN